MKDFNEMLRSVARREGVSEQEVLSEMQKAIDAAYESTDPEVQKRWSAMPFDGKPTPKQLIEYLSNADLNQ